MGYDSVELGVEGLAGGSGVVVCGGQRRTGKEGGEGSTHKHRHQTSFSVAIIHTCVCVYRNTQMHISTNSGKERKNEDCSPSPNHYQTGANSVYF